MTIGTDFPGASQRRRTHLERTRVAGALPRRASNPPPSSADGLERRTGCRQLNRTLAPFRRDLISGVQNVDSAQTADNCRTPPPYQVTQLLLIGRGYKRRKRIPR